MHLRNLIFIEKVILQNSESMTSFLLVAARTQQKPHTFTGHGSFWEFLRESWSRNIHWIGLRENLQETHGFLPSNIGLSCKFSHHPILWNLRFSPCLPVSSVVTTIFFSSRTEGRWRFTTPTSAWEMSWSSWAPWDARRFDTWSLGGFPDAFFWGGPRFDFLDIVFCCTVSIDLHFSQLSDHPMYIYRFTDFMKIVCQVFTMSTTNQWTSMQRKRYLGPILGSRLAKLVHITSITVGSIEGVTYSSWGF